MLLGPLTLFLGLERADTVKAHASAGFHTPTMTPWFMTGAPALGSDPCPPCAQPMAPTTGCVACMGRGQGCSRARVAHERADRCRPSERCPGQFEG